MAKKNPNKQKKPNPTVVHPYNGILLSQKKKSMVATHNVEEPHGSDDESQKSDTKAHAV
jgi:hypothetical protein